MGEYKKSHNGIDIVLHKFAELVIRRMESIELKPEQSWFNASAPIRPQNLSGRMYNHLNALMLFFLCTEKGYKTSVFMTFNQARELDVQVTKGEQSFPVYHPCPYAVSSSDGIRMDILEYGKLSNDQKREYIIKYRPKYFNVFNIDQTNLEQKRPDIMEKIWARFGVDSTREITGNNYSNEQLDKILETNSWLCQVTVERSNNACYSVASDRIKEQFKTGEGFYSTVLDEIVHSTGNSTRLDRFGFTQKDVTNHGREELIAEFTVAFLGASIGFGTKVRDENVAYLQHWAAQIKENPSYIMTILSEVSKAENMVLGHLGLTRGLATEVESQEQNSAKSQSLKKVDSILRSKRVDSTKEVAPSLAMRAKK